MLRTFLFLSFLLIVVSYVAARQSGDKSGRQNRSDRCNRTIDPAKQGTDRKSRRDPNRVRKPCNTTADTNAQKVPGENKDTKEQQQGQQSSGQMPTQGAVNNAGSGSKSAGSSSSMSKNHHEVTAQGFNPSANGGANAGSSHFGSAQGPHGMSFGDFTF